MSAFDAYIRLSGNIEGEVLANERMARHTSLRCGGPAALFVTCDTYTALRVVCEVLEQEGVPWVIMGRGCSVLTADEGYHGAVITLGRDFRRFRFDEDGLLHVGAGTVLQRVVQEAFSRDLSGLEFAAGIPGTVGGALSMNASQGSSYLGAIVDEVMTFRPGTGLVRYGTHDVNWYHRCSDIPAREIILEATLCLVPGKEAQVKRAMEATLATRHQVQPIGKVASGAIFSDPTEEGAPDATKAIEGCGLAGLRQGGAQLFARNANYVVNLGGATSAEVTKLIVTALSKVRQRYGIELRPEIKFLGFPS